MENKVILVTGCSSGMGVGMVRSLAARGHRVYAGMREVEGRNAGAAASLAREADTAGQDVRVLALDVNDQDSVDEALSRIEEEGGTLDVLVNNAGTLYMGLTEAFTPAQVQAQMETNFIAPLRMYRAALPLMRRRARGLVINISSVSGRLAVPFMGIYCASKYALEAAVECMHYELSGQGIDSVLLEPGPFHTGILGKAVREKDVARGEAYGEIARLPDAMLTGFDELMATDENADPRHVANRVVELIDMESGQRPLRLSVGNDFGTAQLNRVTEPLQAAALEQLGLAHLNPRATPAMAMA